MWAGCALSTGLTSLLIFRLLGGLAIERVNIERGITIEELTAFIKSEEPKWRKIITDAKIKVE